MSPSDSRTRTLARALALVATAGLLAGCSTLGLGSDEPRAASTAASSGSSSSSSFTEFLRNGGSTTPPPAAPVDDDLECPAVEVIDGGSAYRQAGPTGVRSQFSLGRIARECRPAGPGEMAIKVGIEARVLLGQSGSPGTYSVPVRFTVKRGDKVVASRVQRGSATIPSGDTQASFVVIEESLVVPRTGDELSILVGFDPTGRAGDEPRKRKGGGNT